jgi:hypothetical protein
MALSAVDSRLRRSSLAGFQSGVGLVFGMTYCRLDLAFMCFFVTAFVFSKVSALALHNGIFPAFVFSNLSA